MIIIIINHRNKRPIDVYELKANKVNNERDTSVDVVSALARIPQYATVDSLPMRIMPHQ